MKTSITLRIVAGALGLRLVTAVVAFLINAVAPMAQPQQFTVFPRPHLFWDAFARFDSGWYFNVARYGYEWVREGRSNIAFFPLYPLLMRYLGLALGGGRSRLYMAGILISWTAFTLAMVMLYRLARVELQDDEAAARAVVYAAVFPFAFFFGVVYTEALFLLLSVTAFYAFRTRQWRLGALAGALVTATRANGIFLLPALALVAWRETRGDRPAMQRAGLALACTPAGLIAYSLWVYTVTGDPFEWAHAMQRWNWRLGATAGWTPLLTVLGAIATRPYEFLASSPQAVIDLLNAGAGVALLAATPFIWRRFGPAYPVLILINLYVPLSSGALEGIGRYCSVLFPFPLWLATFPSHALRTAITVTFAMLYVVCLGLFTKVYPLF